MNGSGQLVAIIPARAGSKRVPAKNIKPLAGKPLLVHSIEAALTSPSVSRVIVSTDSPAIREIALAAGAEAPFLRPPELAGDRTPTIDVILHALRFLQAAGAGAAEFLVLLEPTSPLRTANDVESAFQLLRASGADSVVSLSEAPVSSDCLVAIENSLITPLITGFPRLFKLNGAIYISRVEMVLRIGRLLGPNTVPYFMPELQSVDIDTPDDFELAELIINRNRK